MGITYEDFLDLEYEPTDEDLVCTFRIDPATGMSMEAAASRVASESSNGTWAALQPGADFTDMGATTFSIAERSSAGSQTGSDDIDGGNIQVAYPAGLFEPGNMPQVLSCIAGNIMGMKAVDSIRLMDCEWPEPVVSSYPGPLYGSSVREEIFGVSDRPITATVPKPKVGLSTAEHAQVGYDAWVGGVDLLKDDENLTDQDFNPFADRLTESLSLRDDAEDETGEKKSYLINVTADTQTMLDRVDEVAAQGGEYVMVDIITAGWASLQTVRERTEKHGLAIHAHRAMHAAFDRMPTHGVSMRVLAQISRLCGVDQLHTGTAGLGKLANEDTVGINDWLKGDLYGRNDVLPVASGGLHPGLLPDLLDATGTNTCIQLGGGIHGHPDGTRSGAIALRSAIDAYVEGKSITEAAEETPELAVALDKWGTETPR
ncbi:type III ribulose-bisphosphate carboxylase [Haloferax mediterranei ATCC 33500]|uniref:Ribulose bisphosphate carboxylase n=1 Tax=Haloferax mediterranei (strain ATCC 33500 / DSM 1411 / JCM 8866 / NBRC 14739 / NCIMB 2177 / R-4) TaxID=523841 RepID=I3R375_HALMT|nr:type III ribulose-bisphosphate carboxylase [Haloferax mediterranei]AFK18685.1 ribulose-bisphosphate carboxylase large chain [Haloferax mediterranei ATCC 33500]AHZ21945.1 ribulose 1,5-bisphosphate carboxylase [Haloferax mediterranei ATCC 33500]EMA03454.1 ribulose bisophosphate carboxylase [Haloferax mediterranei ATCC 33500]MDX5988782.1 type III ribulose-bisphosphate carboxylase [Haloferax mediterranei ATCC 33500]QCQ75185.1 type III ribulose-bisphosphate carboxylase [Haloferax mediterranei AT